MAERPLALEAPGGGPPPPRPPLPAPYRSPWRALAEDLRAAAASLRLGLWELWRRNGQGDLPRPAAWPRDLAPLFWPLLLALALVALLLLAAGLGRAPAAVAGPSGAAGDPPQAGAVERERTEQGPVPRAPDGIAAAPMPSPALDSPAAPEVAAAPEAPAAPGAAGDPAPAAPPPAASLPAAPLAEPDPLAALLASPAAAGLLRSASAEPARARLQLVLTEGFRSLPEGEQQRRAEAWQRLAQELGYEHLQLVDGDGALLGRGAVVGGGMILLSPPQRS